MVEGERERASLCIFCFILVSSHSLLFIQQTTALAMMVIDVDVDTLISHLHIITPILLALPLVSLIPRPAAPLEELPGIRPITIQTITPRRSFILSCLSLLAFSSFLDGVVLVIDLLTPGEHQLRHTTPLILLTAAYCIGGLCVWASAAIIAEWRAKWGDRGIVSMGTLGLVLEIPNLVLMVIRETRSRSPMNPLTQVTTNYFRFSGSSPPAFVYWSFPSSLPLSRLPSSATKLPSATPFLPPLVKNTALSNQTGLPYPRN
jgi:hypothetical protein